jgi:flavin reductase (DIM6/NTAB) family NADH-FMN oxidoreductase RutF
VVTVTTQGREAAASAAATVTLSLVPPIIQTVIANGKERAYLPLIAF